MHTRLHLLMSPQWPRLSSSVTSTRLRYACTVLLALLLAVAVHLSLFSPLLHALTSNPDPTEGHFNVPSLQRRDDTWPHVSFKTEPFYSPPRFQNIFKTKDTSLLSPGYLFFTLAERPKGPVICDHEGNIIWFGRPSLKSRWNSDFHVCPYFGSQTTHLCWNEKQKKLDPKRKHHKIIMDNSYALLHNYTTRGDGHEFHIVDNGTRFTTVNYHPIKWDLRPYCGDEDGWLNDACLREYDMRTGLETFNWCMSDHVPLYESSVFFETDGSCQKNDSTPKAGAGIRGRPWDVGHPNAIDKTSGGDYIASFRHFDEIMKIAGPNNTHSKPGSLIWRLGGKRNQFEKNFSFSRQHMVRILTEEGNKTTFSLFNNAWEGFLDPIANQSSGQIIEVDTSNMQAKLIKEFPHPYNRLSAARGSMLVLPNGNAIIGWGTLPEMSEFSPNGTLLYHAQFDDLEAEQYSYRVFKSPWVGNLTTPPKLVAYSLECNGKAPLYAYVSWNGQTEVTHWRFYAASTELGPWIPMGTFEKNGFETQARLPTILPARYVSVEGLDTNGNIVGSMMNQTWVPRPEDKSKCDEFGCKKRFEYKAGEGDSCAPIYSSSIIVFVLLVLFLEYSSRLVGATIIMLSESLSSDNKGLRSAIVPVNDADVDHSSTSDSDHLLENSPEDVEGGSRPDRENLLSGSSVDVEKGDKSDHEAKPYSSTGDVEKASTLIQDPD